jgi:uncharacterized protein
MNPDLYSNLVLNAALGLGIGTYGTLVGAGGGFLLVPLFLLLHGLDPATAAGTSLAIVTVNAASGALGYIRKKKVDYRAGFSFALATVPGAIAGTFLTAAFSGQAFTRVFGGFLLCIAAYLLMRKPPALAAQPPRKGWGMVERKLGTDVYAYHEPLGLGISGGVGVISSWFGIGGGILHVPAMVELLKFPVPIAVATSQFVLFFTALVGATTHAFAGHLDVPLAVSTGVGAVVGAQVGVWLSTRLKGTVILRYLSLALIGVGLRLLFG